MLMVSVPVPTVAPRPRETPLALDRRRRYPDHFRRLLERQATEEAQLHDLALARVDLGKLPQGLVQQDEVDVPLLRNSQDLVQLHARPTPRPLPTLRAS